MVPLFSETPRSKHFGTQKTVILEGIEAWEPEKLIQRPNIITYPGGSLV